MLRKIKAYSILAKLIRASEELWQRLSDPDLSPDDYRDNQDFEKLLKDFYRLEYIYSMLINKPFRGNEVRKDNILKRVRKVLSEVNNILGEVIANVFEEWLSKHAINEPHQWAVARVSEGWEEGFEQIWDTTVGEYIRYHPKLQKMKMQPETYAFGERELIREIEKDPELKEYLFLLLGGKEAFIEETVYLTIEEWKDYPEDVTERLNLPEDATEEEVREAAEIEAETQDISEYFFSDRIGNYINNLYPDDAERFLEAVNEKIIFPLWYEKWSQEGIDDTRNKIEELHERLKNPPKDLGKHYALVNEALNASHQTGAMLDYLEEYTQSSLKNLLNSLSKGEFIKELDPILRKIGVIL